MTAPVEEYPGRLPVADLHESPLNPRRTFAEAGLQELADSMGVHGQLAPLVVRPLGTDPKFSKGKWHGVDRWEVVCGHRRLRAARLAGIPELKVVARLMDDDHARAVMLIENAQREDVSPSEQAAAVGELVAAVGQEEAAKQVGWPLSRVRDLQRLAALPAWFLQAVDAGEVPLSTAGVVAKVPGAVSREKAAACVLLGEMFPDDALVKEAAELDMHAARKGEMYDPLSVADAKELVRSKFSRELKSAPFSRKSLTLLEAAGSCDACPKRAGNDPDLVREGVRADICTDPECFEQKVQAYRAEELARAAKKSGATAWEGEWSRHQAYNPRGWVALAEAVSVSELNEAGGWTGKKGEQSAADLLASVRFTGDKFLAFHPITGKPVLLVRTKDARRALEAGGLMGKKERAKPAEKGASGARPSAATTGGAKKHEPSAFAVKEEAAQIAGQVLAEYGHDNFEDLDVLGQLGGPETNAAYEALTLVARFVADEFVDYGGEREIAVCRTLGLPDSDGPSPTPDVLYEKIAALSPRELLGAMLRWTGAASLVGSFRPAEMKLADAFLAYAELDMDGLQEQARRVLSGEPSADEKVKAAEGQGGADVRTTAIDGPGGVQGDPSAWADLIPPAGPPPAPRPRLPAAVASPKGEPIEGLGLTAAELDAARMARTDLNGMNPPPVPPRVPTVKINGRHHVVVFAGEGFPDSSVRSWELRPLWPRHLGTERGIAPTHADPLEGLAVEASEGAGKYKTWLEYVVGSKAETRRLIHTPPAKPAKKKPAKKKGAA